MSEAKKNPAKQGCKVPLRKTQGLGLRVIHAQVMVCWGGELRASHQLCLGFNARVKLQVFALHAFVQA
ncbi:hypothetical protein, partial [Comamonas sp.]|uniref:hypothetical protein n=1 Tax=Comamonas sp. TaxID=34028 RepID=UPI00289C951F